MFLTGLHHTWTRVKTKAHTQRAYLWWLLIWWNRPAWKFHGANMLRNHLAPHWALVYHCSCAVQSPIVAATAVTPAHSFSLNEINSHTSHSLKDPTATSALLCVYLKKSQIRSCWFTTTDNFSLQTNVWILRPGVWNPFLPISVVSPHSTPRLHPAAQRSPSGYQLCPSIPFFPTSKSHSSFKVLIMEACQEPFSWNLSLPPLSLIHIWRCRR